MNYWEECIGIAADECGLSLTDEQIKYIASSVEGAHENYGMAHGYDCIPNPLIEENKRLQRDLIKEKEKVICKDCGGKGYFMTYGGTFQSEHTCMTCKGEGRHSL